MSIVYVVAVIAFALLSSLGKGSRRKGSPPGRGGMPPFGQGRGESRPAPDRRRDDSPVPRAQQAREPGSRPAGGSGFPGPPGTRADRPAPAGQRPAEERGASPFAPPPPSPDYETGEGISQEQPDTSLDDRIRSMQRELDRMHAAFDQIETTAPGNARSGQTARNRPVRSGAKAEEAERTERLRQGLIWAEILGPPRARRPHGSRPPR
ncbi:hypothetical protein [Paenibacillus glufosinatiresistens]|uniref:hypothetical protein n=1 Tax=Paenibacillus glufosinatiresistens TaxID=3070657 RepID=UPI00286DC16E|nr:hypothetical protein [Paenibacillus sp. YX.27]